MRTAGLSTRCDFIRLKATAKAKRMAEYAVVCPAERITAMLQAALIFIRLSC